MLASLPCLTRKRHHQSATCLPSATLAAKADDLRDEAGGVYVFMYLRGAGVGCEGQMFAESVMIV